MDKSFNYLISPEISKLRDFSPKLKIAILASGEGSNFQELIDLSKSNKFDIDIRLLITNNSETGIDEFKLNPIAQIPRGEATPQKMFSFSREFEKEWQA